MPFFAHLLIGRETRALFREISMAATVAIRYTQLSIGARENIQIHFGKSKTPSGKRNSWRCTRFATMAPAGAKGGRNGGQLSAGISFVRWLCNRSFSRARDRDCNAVAAGAFARSFASAKTAISSPPLRKPRRKKYIGPRSGMPDFPTRRSTDRNRGCRLS